MQLFERFQKLKSNLELNDTFKQLVQQRHGAVRSLIEKNNPSVKDTKLIGSLQRQTRIQPINGSQFDIDVLVTLGTFYTWLPAGHPNGITPQAALSNVHRTVTGSDRYRSMNPQQDPPTIAIDYADKTKVEFVPAYIDGIGESPSGIKHSPSGRAYWVPKNGCWSLADYDYDADYISNQNAACDGWLVPTIKMLKAIKRIYFPRMGSFHLDMVAAQSIPGFVKIQKQYNLPITFPQLIRDFFTFTRNSLNQVKLPGSHSETINLDLITLNGLRDKFEKIANYIDAVNNQSTEAKQAEGWRELFQDPFPIS